MIAPLMTSDPNLPESNWRWPAEWEPHEATWLAWPHNVETWPHNLAAAQDEFETLIRTLAESETVRLLAADDVRDQITARRIDQWSNVEIWPIPTNDAWIRDYGPTVVQHRERNETRFVDWIYNAWGEKYPPYDDDQQVAIRCAQKYGCSTSSVKYVVEGGAIEGNGSGLLMTTASCLLDRNRRFKIGHGELNRCFAEELGVRQAIWLPGGDIEGDDTDGHIDQIARFVDAQTLVMMTESDPHDENHATFQANRMAIDRWNERLDSRLEIVEVPLPEPVSFRGVRLPASYANFIWANGRLIVPAFGVPCDDQAKGMLQELLPDREVVQIPCPNLAVGLGAWHCLSQQHCLIQSPRSPDGDG